MKDALQLHRGILPACLKDVPENTYHAVLCDPPYGLGEIKDPAALLRSWLDGEDGEQGAGMLARAWDVVVPPPAWREYLRITRPGGLCFAYSHARTYHLQALAMQLAGWRLLPMIVRIHGSAMALGHAVGKAIDKAAGAEREVVGSKLGKPGYSLAADKGRVSTGERSNPEEECSVTAPATPLAALFDGHNTALKNQLEPVVVAVKPPDGTWAENAERWGTGCFNVQLARVPSGPDHAAKCASVVGLDSARRGVARGAMEREREDSHNLSGRYPSNLLLEHSPECGADWCGPGCAVRELGEMGREKGVHSAGGGSPRGRLPPGDPNSRRSTTREREYLPPFRVEDGDDDSAARFYYQSRASARERAAGCEHLLWRRAPEHPDGWELVDRETWERLGDEAAEKARDTDGYRERMAEGYMRTICERGPSTINSGVYGGNRISGGERHQVIDVDRLDAAPYLNAARARVRTTGNPHLAVKALDGTAYLAKLLLQPVVDGEEPRLLVLYAGTGSEAVGAALAGWRLVDSYEGSEQWNEVHRCRAEFWETLIREGGRESATELLRSWGTAPGEDPEADPEVEQLSIFDVDGAMPGRDLDDDQIQEAAARLYDEVGAILEKPTDHEPETIYLPAGNR